MGDTICNSICRYCFRLLRDWKLENEANVKNISADPFRTEKEDYLLEVDDNFRTDFLLFH